MYNFYKHGAPGRSCIVKFLIIMKLSFLLLIIPILQVSAFGSAQTITLHKQNAPVTAVFEEIMLQTDYDFSYSEKQVSGLAKVTISVTKVDIKEVLDKCFEGQPLTYAIKGNTVIIHAKKTPLIKGSIDKLSDIAVKGIVVDENDQPLAGATVTVKGSGRTTKTNRQGEFSIQEVKDDAVLVISYIGYKTKEVIASNNLGSIKLELTSGELEELEINAGYYTVKDKERTGSISRVSAEIIGKQPVNNPLQALQGRVSGVEIVQTTGIPGGGFNVRIRGQNSIAQGNDPLYIIDGVPFASASLSSNTVNTLISPNASPLSAINPSDIESIEVLKDADATAIYGSRGANGVVLITTKKGKSGKTQFDANMYLGMGHVTRMTKLLNTDQYLEMRREAFKNDNATPSVSDYDVNGKWQENRHTDWQKELIGNTAQQSNLQLAIAGGGEHTSFRLSGTYFKETTVFPGDNDYQKKSTHMNVNHRSVNQKFHLQLSASYHTEDSSLPNIDLTNYITLAPNAPALRTENGDINWEDGTFRNNPLQFLKKGYEVKTGTFNTNASFGFKLPANLEFVTRIGFNRMQRDEVQTNPLSAEDPSRGFTSANRTANYVDNWAQTLNIEPQLSWQMTLGSGRLNLMTGATIQQNFLHKQTLQGTGYSSDGLLENIAAAGTLRVREALNSEYRYLSVYGRINYSLHDKYFINFTGRRDGSSRFGPENIYANFGAVGASWIFSEEKLFSDLLPYISFGKLRASIGVTGNDQIGDYNYLELWGPTTNPYQTVPGLFPSRISNPDYSWESNTKIEAALELGFLNDAVHLTTAFYRNRSSNQLVNYGISPSTGFSFVQANLPATVQNTGWEFDLITQNIKRSGFAWTSTANFSRPRNKLIAFPRIEKSFYANSHEVGKPLTIVKALELIGVNSQTGLYNFTDFDGSGNVSSPGDRQMVKVLGQQYAGGLQNLFSCKNLMLDIFFQFVKQTGRTYEFNQGTAPGGLSNQSLPVLDRWRNAGDMASVQKYTVSSGTNVYAQGRVFGGLGIGDASFIRLKNISIAYELKNGLHIKSLTSARFYLQAQNLLTITKYSGTDPESQSFFTLPPLRMISAGLQVSF